MSRSSSKRKDTLMGGDVAILCDPLQRAEIIQDLLGLQGFGRETIFLGLLDTGIGLGVVSGNNAGGSVVLTLRPKAGSTGALYDIFSQAITMAVVEMQYEVLPGIQGPFSSDQNLCRHFVDIFGKYVATVNGFPAHMVSSESLVDDGFGKYVKKSRTLCLSSIYSENLFLWKLEGQGTEMMAIVHRLLLSGQSEALNRLYRYFMDIMNYYLVSIFANQFQCPVSERYRYKEGEIILTVPINDIKPTAEVLEGLVDYLCNISPSPIALNYIANITFNSLADEVDEDLLAFLDTVSNGGVNTVTLCPFILGTQLKDILRKSRRGIALLNGKLFKGSKIYRDVTEIFANGSRVYGSVYGIWETEQCYDEIATRFKDLCYEDEFMLNIFNDASNYSNEVLGRALVNLMEACAETGLNKLLEFCMKSALVWVPNFSSSSLKETPLIVGLQGTNLSGVDETVACTLYNRDKGEYAAEEIINPTGSYSKTHSDYLIHFYTNLICRGTANRGSVFVQASSFYTEANGVLDACAGCVQYLENMLNNYTVNPALVMGPKNFITCIGGACDWKALQQYYTDTFLAKLNEMATDLYNLDGWFQTVYRTGKKTAPMKALKDSIIRDNNALRADFLSRYIAHINTSEPGNVLRDFVSLATGDADYRIVSLAEKTLQKVMMGSQSGISLLLRESGRLEDYEGEDKREILAFVEDKIYTERLGQFREWVNVLGAQVIDNLNSSLALEVYSCLGLQGGGRTVYSRIDGEMIKVESQLYLNTGLSDADLVDLLLKSLYNLCEEPALA